MMYDSRKGDFYQLAKMDMEDLDVILTEGEIGAYTKWTFEELKLLANTSMTTEILHCKR